MRQVFGYSERVVCRALGQSRGAFRRPRKIPPDEEALTAAIVGLATRYGSYGYKKITALLRIDGWPVNHKRVERIWRQEGLRVPERQKKRGRLYLNDGSCIRLRPCWPNHVWAYDFVADRLIDGTKIRFLTIVDEFTRECLAIVVDYSLKSDDVMEVLMKLFMERGVPGCIRSDNGPEFRADVIRSWISSLGATPTFIEPGSPWENGYNESFNGKFRKEFLSREAFYTLEEARVLTEEWRWHYNHVRPHMSLDYRPPAPLARMTAAPMPEMTCADAPVISGMKIAQAVPIEPGLQNRG
jgi:transposase InsO family protein